MSRAVIFDFGNTLYVNHFPPNWSRFYHQPFRTTLEQAGLEVTAERLDHGQHILERYNTRINPRDREFTAETIFGEIISGWGATDPGLVQLAMDTFGRYFMGNTGPFADTIQVLKQLRSRNVKTGILSNVAYGLGKEYYLDPDDEMNRYIDVFLTSVDTGWRKPHPAGFLQTAEELGVSPEACLFVGDEEVDVTGSNAVGMISVFLDRDETGIDHGQTHTIRSLTELTDLL